MTYIIGDGIKCLSYFSFLLEHLYHQKVLHLIKEDSEEDMFPINYIINLIESRPFTTFLYRERVFNE